MHVEARKVNITAKQACEPASPAAGDGPQHVDHVAPAGGMHMGGVIASKAATARCYADLPRSAATSTLPPSPLAPPFPHLKKPRRPPRRQMVCTASRAPRLRDCTTCIFTVSSGAVLVLPAAPCGIERRSTSAGLHVACGARGGSPRAARGWTTACCKMLISAPHSPQPLTAMAPAKSRRRLEGSAAARFCMRCSSRCTRCTSCSTTRRSSPR